MESKDPFEDYRSETPMVLAKGSLSTDSVQWGNCYVAERKEFYFTRPDENGASLYVGKLSNEGLSDVQIIEFSVPLNCTDVFVTSRGDEMYFSSSKPMNNGDKSGNFHIWKAKRINGNWQSPELIDIPVAGSKFYPTMSDKDQLVFSLFEPGSPSADLYLMSLNGETSKPTKLPLSINSTEMEGDPFIARDGSYLVFASFDQQEGLGKSDLYISFNLDGEWSEAMWLGVQINSEGYDGSPFVTKDEKHLLFTSSRGSADTSIFFNHFIADFDPWKWKKAAILETR